MSLAIFVFLVSAAFVVHFLIGYPLLLDLLARFRARPIRKHPIEPTVSVIIPVYNGERWMAAKLESVGALDYPRHLMEILVVSDGSTDRTAEIARGFDGVHLLELPHGGKPLAINAGLAHARNEILLFTDVRQLLDPASLRHLVACLADPTVGVVTGEIRWLKSQNRAEEDVGFYVRFEHWIRERLSKIDSLLGVAGALYAIRRDLAQPLPPDTLLDDVCMVLGPFFAGYRVVLEPAAVAYDSPTPLEAEFWRKVRTLAGLYQTLRSYPALLGPANRMWFHFFSHKLGRVLLPYFLLAMLCSSAFLPAPWNVWALGTQAFCYGLALADSLIPQSFRIKRITSPARTFVVLMAAAVCAVSVFFLSPQTLWKAPAARSSPSAP